MTGRELERWLDTEESRSVGVTKGGGEKKTDPGREESVGHRSGRRILTLLRTDEADLDDQDYAHMRQVVGYIHPHLAQKPSKEPLEDSRWRYSLMNWRHDPLKA
jgi:DNA replication initiation complex subunit (GINS family)